jgi:protein O-GlcNAc transferase
MRGPMSLHQPAFGLAETLQRALDFHQRGRTDKAERLYQQILKSRPDHFDAPHMLGVIRAQQGRNEEALRLIKRALALRPGASEVHANLGNVLQGLGRTRKRSSLTTRCSRPIRGMCGH